MTFNEAIKVMIHGSFTARKSWVEEYLAILPKQDYIFCFGKTKDPGALNAYVYTPSVSDINATDWMTKVF